MDMLNNDGCYKMIELSSLESQPRPSRSSSTPCSAAKIVSIIGNRSIGQSTHKNVRASVFWNTLWHVKGHRVMLSAGVTRNINITFSKIEVKVPKWCVSTKLFGNMKIGKNDSLTLSFKFSFLLKPTSSIERTNITKNDVHGTNVITCLMT